MVSHSFYAQELLSKAKGGSGVSGATLDALREELQALLRAKRQVQEKRRQLDAPHRFQ